MSFRELGELIEPDAPICYGILKPGSGVENGVPVVKVKDLQNGTIEPNRLLRTSPTIDAQYRRSRLRAGDILLSIRGTTGRVAIVPDELNGANITQDTARIRVQDEDRLYVYFALLSPLVQRQIEEKTIGQAVQGINIAAVRRLRIPWLRAKHRRLAAGVLRQAEARTHLIDRLMAAKRELKRGLMQELLTGRRRFPEFASRSTRALDGWRTVQIGDFADERSERSRGLNPTVLSCTKHAGLVPSLEYFGKQVFSRDLSNYKLVQPGLFVYATNHLEEGSIGLHRGSCTGAVSPMYTVFSVDREAVEPEYLFALLKTELYRVRFAALTSASVNRRGSVRWPVFSKITVLLPPLAEQKRIAETLLTVDREIELLEAQREQCELQKRALMQKLLSGDLEIPADDSEA